MAALSDNAFHRTWPTESNDILDACGKSVEPRVGEAYDAPETMSEKPATKLFSWKKVAVIIMFGVGAALYKTYQSYQRKGHLDSVDIGAAAVTIAILLCVAAFVVWWGNREE
jgi:hypothetical protein